MTELVLFSSSDSLFSSPRACSNSTERGPDAGPRERAPPRAMVDGTRIWQFSATDLGLLIGVPAGYVLLGYVVFQYTTRRARQLGVLGDY